MSPSLSNDGQTPRSMWGMLPGQSGCAGRVRKRTHPARRPATTWPSCVIVEPDGHVPLLPLATARWRDGVGRTRKTPGLVSNTSGGSILRASPSTPISTGPPESTRKLGVATGATRGTAGSGPRPRGL